MAGREQGADRHRSGRQRLDLADGPVRAAHAGRAGGAAAGQRAQPRGAGHVIGMDVRVERPGQAEAERPERGEVALHRLQDRVDEDRGARVGAAEQIGIARRFGFEELAEDHPVPTAARTPCIVASARAAAASAERPKKAASAASSPRISA